LVLDRITFDSQILGGRACIRGMRIPVSVLVVARVLAESANAIEDGAIVVVEESRHRVRILPIGS
jgi:uncharacterized protein (DUF433 family)